MDDEVLNRFFILLAGFTLAVIVVAVYHCIAVGWCSRCRIRISQQQQQRFPPAQEETLSNVENSYVQLIPAFKFQKEIGLIDEDGMCAVCLSEFEDGEELRTLPGCMHSFHVPCIDMWLYSHSNCPLCRTIATPSPSPQLQPRQDSDWSVTLQDSSMSPDSGRLPQSV